MASFSEQAIGFYLQLENELTPELSKAEADYKKFVKALDVQNKLAFQSASKGFADLGGLVSQFGKMADNLGKNYAKAVKKVQREAKPITQRIDISFTTRSIASLRKQVGEAIGKALSSASIRLTATTPVNRLKMFDTSATLRTLYKDTPQPPDMRGRFSVPGFAKGGKVPGKGKSSGVFDSVLAALTPGEVVLPAGLVQTLESFDKTLAQQGQLKGLLESGLGSPNDLKAYRKGLDAMADQLERITSETKSLGVDEKQRMAPALIDATARMKDFGEEGEKTTGVMETLLTKVLGPARFLALHTALKSAQEGIKSLTSRIGSALGSAEAKIAPVAETIGSMRLMLRRSSAEMAPFTEKILEQARAAGTSASATANAAKAYLALGLRGDETVARLAGMTANIGELNEGAFDPAIKGAARLSNQFGASSDFIATIFDDLGRLQATFGFAKASDALADMETVLASASTRFTELGEEQRLRFIQNLTIMRSAASETWAGTGKEISDIIAGAMGGDSKSIKALQFLTSNALSTADTIVDAFTKGDIEGIFEGVSRQARLAGEIGLPLLAEKGGVAVDVLRGLATAPGQFKETVEAMKLTTTSLDKMSEAAAKSAEALRKSRSFVQNLKVDIEGFITKRFGVDFLEFLQEIPIASVLAGLAIVKLGLSITLSLGGALVKVIPAMVTFVGLLRAQGIAGALKGLGGATKGLVSGGAPARGGGILGAIFKGLGAGLKAFGAAMIGPGGLGLLALVGGLIGIGFAAKLAAPLMKAMVPVLIEMVKGFVSMFKTLTKMKPGDIAKFGLALVPVAVGVNLLGVSFGVASVGMGAFMAVMALGNIRGKGVVGVLESMVGDLGRLGALQGQLMQTAAGLKGAALFLVEFAKVGAILAGLGAVSVIGELVTSFLGFFNIKSPLALLAEKGSEVADTLLSLAKSFTPLDTVSKDSKQIQGGLMASANMVRDLSPLISETIKLGKLAGGLKKGWFSDSPLVKIANQSRPLVDTINTISKDMRDLDVTEVDRDRVRLARDMLRDLRGIITAVQGLSGQRVNVASLKAKKEALQLSAEMATQLTQTVMHQLVTPEMIEQVISATIKQRGADDPVVKQMQESNQLLKQMVDLLSTGNSDRKENKPEPAPIVAARSSIADTAAKFMQ